MHSSVHPAMALHPNFDTIHEIEKIHPQWVHAGAFGGARVHDKLPSPLYQAKACQSSAKRSAAVYKNVVARMIYLGFTGYHQRWRVPGNDIYRRILIILFIIVWTHTCKFIIGILRKPLFILDLTIQGKKMTADSVL